MATETAKKPATLTPKAFRRRFPIFKDKILLNSCSKGALSREVEEAYDRYLHAWRSGGSPWEEWVGKLEEARSAFAQYLRCSAEEVAVTFCASIAAGTLASALDFSGRRNKVVLGDFEFPTMAHIWLAQQKRGARISRVRASGNRLPAESYARQIDAETLLVPTTHVCFKNGYRVDVASVVKAAREAGAYSLIDDYQCSGTRPIDVKALGCDFLVSGCLKYLLGSSGLAFLYVRRELIERLEPTLTGWFAQENPFAFDIERAAYHSTARRFESGTPPIPNLYAAIAGLRLVMKAGVKRIQLHVDELARFTIEQAQKRGIEVLTPEDARERGPLVMLRSKDAGRLVQILERKGIIVSSRADGLRLGLHYYNLPEDIEETFAVLDRHPELLVRVAHPA
jgi:selenocysteine lyase/cysteine desulfurase